MRVAHPIVGGDELDERSAFNSWRRQYSVCAYLFTVPALGITVEYRYRMFFLWGNQNLGVRGGVSKIANVLGH